MASNTSISTDQSEAISAVDEIRKVREELSARFDQDIDRLADHATVVAAEWRKKLQLRSVSVIAAK